MSLIQEALKRQMKEAGGVPPEGTFPPVEQPVSTPSPPVSSSEPPVSTTPEVPVSTAEEAPSSEEQPAPQDVKMPQPKESGPRPWPALLSMLIVIVVLIGGGVWLMMFAYNRWQSTQKPQEQPSEAVIAEEKQPSEPKPAVLPLPGQDTVTKKPQEADMLKGVESASSVKPADLPDVAGDSEAGSELITRETEHEKDQVEPVQKVSVETEVVPVKTAHTLSSQPVEEMAHRPPVRWPSLILSGVVGRGSNGSAILNSEIIAVGETIEGVKVVSIGRQGVELEYKGETQFLKVGDSTQ